MIRKSLSILFAGLIFFNLFGYYLVFKCDQIRVKSEMKAMIRSGSFRSNYEEITILNPATNRDFKMLDKGEIRYRGKLYDVISTRISGSYVIFRCINDTQEEQLLARYENYSTWVTGMNSPGKSRNTQAMLHHIIKQALLDKSTLQSPLTSFILLFAKPATDFSSIAILPSFPPPRFL
jgi:hypothetical protein